MLDKEHQIKDENALDDVAGGIMYIRNPAMNTAVNAAGAAEDGDSAPSQLTDLPSEPTILGRRRPR